MGRRPSACRLARLDGLGVTRPLVVSGKDAVKLAVLGLPHRYLDIEFRIVRGTSPLAALLDALPRAGDPRRNA